MWIWGSNVCICGQLVCTVDAATNRRYNILLGERLLQTCALQPAVERKEPSVSVEVCQGNWEIVSFLCQEAYLLRYSRIAVLIRDSLADCDFCIYLFHFVFIFLSLHFSALLFCLVFSNLIPTNILKILV